MKRKGLVISKGKTRGKVAFLKKVEPALHTQLIQQDQYQLYEQAVLVVSERIKKNIEDSKKHLNERISEIFETHQYIVNDPVLKSKTFEFIKQRMNAADAYQRAVKEILDQFSQIDNEYMLGRIVDILDATDQVKVMMNSIQQEKVKDYDEPTILVLRELKPSIIYSLNQTNVVGFISQKGYYHQHSGIIARSIHIPGIICEDIFEFVQPEDIIILDADQGTIEVQKTEDTDEL